jgi:NhaP-type Na+/H+ or K+/H+ antiporter
MSAKRNDFLSSASRLQGYNVWKSLIFLLNGLVFLLIGLDLPEISEGLKQEGIGFSLAVGYGLMVTCVLILGRFLASFGAVIVTKIVSNFIPVADKNPGLKAPLILGWSGMRGVVSLAAALSIPIEMDNGASFPFRNLILFITFVVILITLVLQGLTLPWLIKKVNIPDFGDHYNEEEAEEQLQKGLAEHTLKYFQTNYLQHPDSSKHLQPIATLLEHRINRQQEKDMSVQAKKVYFEILEEQRIWLMNKNRTDEKMDEEIIRKYLYAIDLEEEKLKYT